MIVTALCALAGGQLFASGDDSDSSDSDFPDSPSPGDDGSVSEKTITLIVLLSIFALVAIVTVALCCYKRVMIGKALHADSDRVTLFADLSYTEGAGLPELAGAPELRTHPAHMLMF
jgi:hypothetical protein